MEGIGAAESVLIHRRELRDGLITEQSNHLRRRSRAGAGLSPSATGLVRLLARWVQSNPPVRRVGSTYLLRLGGHTVLDCPHANLAARVQSQFIKNVADVVFDGTFADDQRFGDLTVAETADD